MGVLTCDRNGCENVMCDRLSHKYGYICNECFEELLQSDIMDIQEFMDSEKSHSTMPSHIREEWLKGVFEIDN